LLQLVGFILPFVLLHPLMSEDYIANSGELLVPDQGRCATALLRTEL
jgi:hypothetical protein